MHIPGIIVVEGCDAVGKTSAIKRALATWAKGGRYLHCTRKSTPAKIQAHQLRMFLVAVRYALQGRWVFIDRRWPRDVIYSLAFGRQPASLDNCKFLDDLFVSLRVGGYLFCYDTDPTETVKRHSKTSAERVEMYSNIGTVAHMYSRFALGMEPTLGPLTRWRTGSGGIQTLTPFEHTLPTCDRLFKAACQTLTVFNSPNALNQLARSLKLITNHHTTTPHVVA